MRVRLVIDIAVVFLILSCSDPGDQRISAYDVSGTYSRSHVIRTVSEGTVDTVADSLTLYLGRDGQLQFSFELLFDNGHSCTMEGVATRVGSHWEYREAIEDSHAGARECVLRIRPTADAITLQDVDRACGWGAGYCGVRGRIDGATFSRVR